MYWMTIGNGMYNIELMYRNHVSIYMTVASTVCTLKASGCTNITKRKLIRLFEI